MIVLAGAAGVELLPGVASAKADAATADGSSGIA
jgi:hypothetical protein